MPRRDAPPSPLPTSRRVRRRWRALAVTAALCAGLVGGGEAVAAEARATAGVGAAAGWVGAETTRPGVGATDRPGAVAPRSGTGGPGLWVAPVIPDVVHLFDPPAERWRAGHRGVDLASVAGTPVASPAAGTVTFAGPVAGRGVLVVTHDDGLRSSFEPVTGSVVVGTRVAAGAPVGVLDGIVGHCAPDSCLHWGVREGDVYLDPLLLLGLADPIVLLPFDGPPPGAGRSRTAEHGGRWEEWAGSTQGYANGKLPDSILCSPSFDTSARLRCDAAHQLEALNTAFHAAFGRDLSISDSYRSYTAQVATKAAKGYLAATPGTSNHGWGQAVDLDVTSYGSAAYEWLRDNAPDYGWDNPTWARPGGTKNEPWHWEYGTGASTHPKPRAGHEVARTPVPAGPPPVRSSAAPPRAAPRHRGSTRPHLL